MNPVLNVASSFNVSQHMLQFWIVAAGIVVLLGAMWRLIVPGIVIIVIAMVFFDGVEIPEKAKAPVVDQVEEQRKEFMHDCMNVANYEEEHCSELWQEKVDEEQLLKKKKGI
jgi:hypothetical protein